MGIRKLENSCTYKDLTYKEWLINANYVNSMKTEVLKSNKTFSALALAFISLPGFDFHFNFSQVSGLSN